MKLRLDSKRDLPIYAQIVDGIRHLVATGEMKPGEQLPTVRDLAAQLHVHANTVARAYDLLDQAGVISAQQGRGCFVADQPDSEQLGAHRRQALQSIVDRALLEALSLGYTTSEIEETFRQDLKAWQSRQRGTRRKGS